MTGKLTNAVFAVVRSIPLMSMLFLAYYVIPAVFFPEAVKHIAFMTLTLTAGILGLAVFTACRVSSHITSSLTALPADQAKAAQALDSLYMPELHPCLASPGYQTSYASFDKRILEG